MPLVQLPSRRVQRVQMWLCTAWMVGWMAHPRLPSDSSGRAEMCGHRLIQRRQVLVSFFFSAINRCESSWSTRRVGGCATKSRSYELRGRRGTSIGLIAPCEKTLVQPAARWLLSGDHSSLSSLTAFVKVWISSSSALSLALREEDDDKRAGSVTEPDNCFRSHQKKKGCYLFRCPLHRTRSCRSQWRDADHVEWRGRANALSLCGDGEARGHWADVSFLVTGCSNHLLAIFFSGARGGVALWKES